MDEPGTLTFTTEETEDGVMVTFNGEVDETADFSPLAGLTGKVTFDLQHVDRFNSEGIRRWVNFIRQLDQVEELVLVKCSVPVVTQLNLIRGLKGRVWVHSFYLPYVCVETGEEEMHLLCVEDIEDPANPPMPPSEPGKTLELDDLPERYFSFLRDLARPS
jgi:anti-anti-sigma regulatory factor